MEETTSCEPCCYVCGKVDRTLKRCTRCRAVLYCSRNCQTKDWASHKYTCVKEDEQNLLGKNGTTASKQTSDVISDSHCSCFSDEVVLCGEVKDLNLFTTSENNNSNQSLQHQNLFKIIVKCMKRRHTLTIGSSLGGQEILDHIASSINIPVDKLKLVSRGKIMTVNTICKFVKDKAVFQAIGEVAESEDGLESGHVDCLMARLGVERNDAVRALRETGDIVDAILYLGNK